MENSITSMNSKSLLRTVIVFIIAIIAFSYLYKHGISPIWAAVAIIMFPGFFRFIYRVACFLVSTAIIIAILKFLIF